ncbi:hypothetical protein HMPREF1002_00876 [Porphyromonas sp. 31_2]|jgi:hypothetical protein|nr:hypothetical protein HMPREF1002_00876 [Porphyromonas sp. 31_2]
MASCLTCFYDYISLDAYKTINAAYYFKIITFLMCRHRSTTYFVNEVYIL